MKHCIAALMLCCAAIAVADQPTAPTEAEARLKASGIQLVQRETHARRAGETVTIHHRNPLDQGGDACADALVITELPFCDEGTTAGYTDDFENCSGIGPIIGPPDVTFLYTPPANQSLTISTCGSTSESQLTIWTVDENCNLDEFIACDNSSGCTPHSCLNFFGISGLTYLFIIDGFENNTVDYIFHANTGFDCESLPCGPHEPTGESCADPFPITELPATFEGNTVGFASDHAGCIGGFGAPDVVFSYAPATTHYMDVMTCGATFFNSLLYVYRDGFFGFPYACGIPACVSHGDVFYTNHQLACVLFEVGHEYCIVLDGSNTIDAGPFVISFEETVVETCDPEQYCSTDLLETEPNDLCEEPDPAVLQYGDTLYGNICEEGDVDYIQIAVPEDRWLLANLLVGEFCDEGGLGLGITAMTPPCLANYPCNDCGWLFSCGPETAIVKIEGLAECKTGPYAVYIDSFPRSFEECYPEACETAINIACGVPELVNTCAGCNILCKVYMDGCSGYRRDAGPQSFLRLDVTEAGEYTIHAEADSFESDHDVQFSVFTDCILPQTSCLLSQDQNNAFFHVTGGRGEELGSLFLTPGTYYIHVSIEGEGRCNDVMVTVTCSNEVPCLPVTEVTTYWDNDLSRVRVSWPAEAGSYQVFSTVEPNNDGDPRDGDPQWTFETELTVPDGDASWDDTDVTPAITFYSVLRVCP